MAYTNPGTALFSVIVTCYNDGKYIEEALQSIVQSTYKNFEIIIVDDCSTDDLTREKLTELEKSGYKVIRKKQNKGVSDSRNIGITQANGEFILTLDADDRIHDTYLEKSLSQLSKGFDVVYCDVKSFGKINSVRIAPEFSLPLLLTGNYIANCSPFTKEAWSKASGFDQNMECYEDWEFWVNVAANGARFFHVNEVLFEYRRKENSLNSKCGDPSTRAKIVAYVSDKHKKLYQQHVTHIFSNLHGVVSSLERDILNIEETANKGNITELYNKMKNAELALEQRTAYYENSFFWKLKRFTDKILGR